jgi:hypothetical protein
MTKRDLAQLSTATANAGPTWARKGVTEGTSAEHVRWLRRLGAAAQSGVEPPDWPAVDFIIRTVHRRKRDRGWRWSTTAKALESIAGAMSALPLYVPRIPHPVALQESPVWRRACKYAQVKTAGEIPKQAQAATRAQILEVCRGAPKKIAALIALAWITTGRPGCISQLRAEDLTRTENGLAVTFRRGKTVKLRKRPYTVTTAPGEFAPFLEALANETGFLFPCETLQLRRELLKEMTESLRLVDPQLESRSIRRGALQHMATRGVPATVLMSFSGHGSVSMLKVYLGHGVLLEDEAGKQRLAAQHHLAEGAIRLEDSL